MGRFERLYLTIEATNLLQAQNNVERILVSDPAIGTVEHGLTELGRQQAKEVMQ